MAKQLQVDKFPIDVSTVMQMLKEHLSKSEICRILNVTWATVNYWDKGVFKPRKRQLKKLLELCERYAKP